MTACGAHFFKVISQSQLQSPSKSLLSEEVIEWGRQRNFVLPLDRAFVNWNIVKVKLGVDFANLNSVDVEKISALNQQD